jgi:large subunit ribosomal protein L25
MTTEAIKLELEHRELLGKKVRRLRRSGIIPVHLYGPGIDSRSLQCPAQRLIQVMSLAGGNTPVSVSIAGELGSHIAFVREIQWDPRRDGIFHVDLLVTEANRIELPRVEIEEAAEGEEPPADSAAPPEEATDQG